MQKSATLLALVGGLIAVGIALSFYGSMIITEDLVQGVENIGEGGSFEITAELDPSISTEGVFVVQVMQFQENVVSARITDPFGSQIITKTIDSESYEEQFDITTKGAFTLIVENSGEFTDVVGVIGHLPDTAKFSVGITGFYLLIIGLIGMGVVGIYVVKNRRRS